ncbi:MAG: hypothetical protein V7L00_19065 [Nostoc sp.]|uniref:hypothetical protein n=1 Tax=unclassified Nostoc TaxID=2593658 RepID=UPI0025FD6A94|nr:hypothetical protein [Nostoc sp. JL33]MBN3871120.1 hypothetical protein [Nostoc sp. JL33]
MNLFQKSILMVSVGLILSVSPAYSVQQRSFTLLAQDRIQNDLDALPRKIASLDQPGIDKVIETLSSDPELAAKTSKLLQSNPRGVIEKYFRLSTPQAENLKNLSDEELKETLYPLVQSIETGKLSQTKVNYTTELFDSRAVSAAGRKTVITITIG